MCVCVCVCVYKAPAPFVKANTLINVDSEESDSICIGCAGGFDKSFVLPINTDSMKTIDTTNSYNMYELKISNLKGGHTGIEIHLGRANANILLFRVLNECYEFNNNNNNEFYVTFLEGGNALNAIPNLAVCRFAIVKSNDNYFNDLKQLIIKYWNDVIINEFKDIENNMQITIEQCQQTNEQLCFFVLIFSFYFCFLFFVLFVFVSFL